MSGFITNIFLCFLLFLCESIASDCDFLVYGNATRGEYTIYSEKNDPVYCVEDDAKPIQLGKSLFYIYLQRNIYKKYV